MRKFYIMLSSMISCSVLISTLSSCGSNGTINPTSYNVATVASPVTTTTKKNCTCKKKTTDNSVVSDNIVASASPNISPEPSVSVSPESPEVSPTPITEIVTDPPKEKKNVFGNFIEKLKNLFKKKK